jgi:uncharacterized membrane protein YhiD involved in acid resistance
MMIMEVGAIVIALFSLAGVIVGPLVTWKLGGKKQADVTERQAEVIETRELTGTAINMMTKMESRMQSATDEADAARNDARRARAEVAAAWEAQHQLQMELHSVKTRLARIEPVMIAEVSWALIARDSLLSQRWPDGLAHVPPILSVVPSDAA